ncbi:hypothetical protein B0H14DRAFT_2586237 [Mycena olivaceomarginata]|nr:hypothetical protein B0H14DRAFT_2586237 [Mycena olivaceomarginata]
MSRRTRFSFSPTLAPTAASPITAAATCVDLPGIKASFTPIAISSSRVTCGRSRGKLLLQLLTGVGWVFRRLGGRERRRGIGGQRRSRRAEVGSGGRGSKATTPAIRSLIGDLRLA